MEYDNQTSRVMPHDSDTEQAILAAMLYNNETISDARITAADFYITAHRNIFSAIMELSEKGQAADIITVCRQLEDSDKLKQTGGNTYIAGLLDKYFSPFSVATYSQIIKKKSIERRIITETSKVIDSIYSSDDTQAKLEEAQKNILNLSLANEKETLKTAKDIVKATWQEIEQRYSKPGSMIGHSTGLIDLDNTIGGLVNGDLIIVAGRPGMGKSALAGNIAANVAASGVPTLIYSLEMPSNSVMTRILAKNTGINSRNLRRGRIIETHWGNCIEAVGNIAQWPLFMDDKPGIITTEIVTKARRLKKEANLGLVIVDYIQLVRTAGKHDSREQQVAEISRTMKGLARELEIPVIALSQLNRQVDNRPDKHPMLSDLRESGAIEQDADIIIFIYRDEFYNKAEDNPKRGIAELDVAKHRNGETCRFEVIFDEKTQTIRNMNKINY
jgi:replicative DNA helicase